MPDGVTDRRGEGGLDAFARGLLVRLLSSTTTEIARVVVLVLVVEKVTECNAA